MRWTTYRQADGHNVYDEYGWVTDLEYFEDMDEPVDIVVEEWVLAERRLMTVYPSHWEQCEVCGKTVPDLEEHYDSAVEVEEAADAGAGVVGYVMGVQSKG